MLLQSREQKYYTPEEYLELEVDSEERHEYINGEIITMTGGLPNHNQITGNFYAALNFALKGKPYRVFVVDQRLWIPKKQIHTYPDIMIVSGKLEFAKGRKDTITNPLMIVEVLSKSTKSYDRDEKFAAYRTIPGFQEYILIDQYSLHIEQYYKSDAEGGQSHRNKWIFSEYDSESDSLSLSSISFQISLLDIYDKVEFNEEEPQS